MARWLCCAMWPFKGAGMERFFSVLTIKSANDDRREFAGVASTEIIDSQGDSLVPSGASYTLPLPLLLGHNHAAPVGNVFEANVSAAGIAIKARIAKVSEPGRLKDRLDECWLSVREGLLRGLSVGAMPGLSDPLPGGGRRIKTWRWVELSICAIPINTQANILTVRSAFGAPQRPAEHRKGVVYLDQHPGSVYLHDRARLQRPARRVVRL